MAIDLDPALREKVRSWMFDAALPFWAEAGRDRVHGGVIESLALDGRSPSGADFKRTRVTCRQVYVFSHAHLLGWGPAAAAADHAYDFLVSRCWSEAAGGWVRLLTREGDVRDATLDLYDFAFALFALGWRHRATRDPGALALAHRTLDVIETRFRHPGGAGYHAALPPALPREQNPHMHLTEAALVLAESSGEERFAALANDLARLFRTRICRLPEGRLPEYFDDDWTPTAGEKGRWVEPGHQFEWAWILAEHQRKLGGDNADAVRALVDFAEAKGVDPHTQVTFNRVREDGEPLDRGSRTWPNTERVKGWIGRAELSGASAAASQAVAGSTRLLFERYLDPAPAGCWFDAFDAGGAPAASTIPTSTLYHVFLAFAEVLRASGDGRVGAGR